jgi:cytochrome c-type biogenesis protein CcmH
MTALWLWLLIAVAWADDPPAGAASVPAEVVEGIGVEPFGDPPANAAEAAERTMALAHRLRCPVCQGLSVADSTSDAAVGMKTRIAELVAYGYTEEQITDYFEDRYGTWILLAPPPAGHELLWALPVLAALAALGFLGYAVTRRPVRPPAVPVAGAAPDDDPYRRRVLEEIGE